MQVANSPLVATVNPHAEVRRGQQFVLTVTVANYGLQDRSQVYVWLEPPVNDPLSEALIEAWSDMNRTGQSTTLALNQSHEFRFQFRIPPQTVAELYRYDIFVDSPDSGQQPLKLRQQLRVVASAEDDVPGLSVMPPMRRENPHKIPAGQPTVIQVQIENSSNLVESYTLECDLNEDWYHVKYPNYNESLKLNPNRSGHVELVLHPPESATSDIIYSPTLRLSSNIKGEVVTDIVYFQIERFYGINNEGILLSLQPQKLRLPRRNGEAREALQQPGEYRQAPTIKEKLKWGCFEVKLDNCSNTQRSFFIKTFFEPEGACDRVFFEPKLGQAIQDPVLMELSPGQSKIFHLWVKPKTRKAPLRRKERQFELILELQNAQGYEDYPLSDRRYSGTIVWKPTPGWIWFLLITSLLGVSLWLAIWLLMLLFRLPPQPEIVEFKIDKSQVRSEDNTVGESSETSEAPERPRLVLNWKIEELEQLDSLLLTYKDTSGQPQEQRFVFGQEENQAGDSTPFWKFWDRSSPMESEAENATPSESESDSKIPPELRAVCPDSTDTLLSCRYPVADIDLNKGYTFELKAFPKDDRTLFGVRKRSSETAADVETTETVSFNAPRIENLTAQTAIENTVETVTLNWQLANLDEVSKVEVTVREQQGSAKVYRYQYADNSFKPMSGASNSTFQLQCNPIESEDASDPEPFINTDMETPSADTPALVNCAWDAKAVLDPGIYTFKVAVFSQRDERVAVDEQETEETASLTEPKIQRFATTETSYAVGEPVRVNWTIDNPQRVQSILLARKAADGSEVEDLPPLELPDSPQELFDNPPAGCRADTESDTLQLVCEGIEVGASPIGEYRFELTVVPRHAAGTPLTQESRAVTVEPARVGGGAGGGSRAAAGAGGAGAGSAAAGEDVLFMPENLELSVDGKPVGDDPQPFVYALGENGVPRTVKIAWNVNANGRDVTVELLPIPGIEVNPSGSFAYPLREAPAEITVTLRVTNELGEQATRVAVLQTYRSSGQTVSPSAPPGSLGVPESVNPESLRPFEVPPQAN